MQRPHPRAFRQYVLTFAHPPLRPGKRLRDVLRHLAPTPLHWARLASPQLRLVADQQSLSRKELVFCPGRALSQG